MRQRGLWIGAVFAPVSGVAVFVACVGWHGQISDWYYIPAVAWGLACPLIGYAVLR